MSGSDISVEFVIAIRNYFDFSLYHANCKYKNNMYFYMIYNHFMTKKKKKINNYIKWNEINIKILFY